jgi:hypothetical protein
VGKALLIAPVNSEWAPEEHLRHSSFKSATPAVAFKEYQAAVLSLKIQLQSLEVRSPKPDLEGTFKAAANGRAHPD